MCIIQVTRIEKWAGARPLQLCMILVILASLRIAATYPVFNHTNDMIGSVLRDCW